MKNAWGIHQSSGILFITQSSEKQSYFLYFIRDALEENHASLDDLEGKLDKASQVLANIIFVVTNMLSVFYSWYRF